MSPALSLLVLMAGPATPPPVVAESAWAPVQFMAGEWVGASDGQPGKGTAKRTYRFVLGDRFLEEKSVSTYPPQPKNEKGEVHEHWSLFSHDRVRHTLVLRQFHQEGFVILYALNPTLSTASKLVFDSEQIENYNSSWKARETYEVISNNEFTETFELAPPGKPYEVYSRNQFKRIRK